MAKVLTVPSFPLVLNYNYISVHGHWGILVDIPIVSLSYVQPSNRCDRALLTPEGGFKTTYELWSNVSLPKCLNSP